MDVAAHLGEVDSGVVEGEQECGDEDEGAVEDEEAGLVLHDFVAPTAGHFSDTVDASDENDDESTRHGIAELLKVGVVPELPAISPLSLGSRHVLPHTNIVVSAKEAKDDEHDDLQRNTGNDGAVTTLLKLAVGLATSSGDTTSDGLDDEAAQVGGEEDDWVPARGDAGDGRVEVDGDVLEGEVDGDADEGGREDDGADLELEGAVVPGVGVKLDATNIAKHFQQKTDREADGIRICLLPYSQTNRSHRQDTKNDGEKDAGSKVRIVAQHRSLNRASGRNLETLSRHCVRIRLCHLFHSIKPRFEMGVFD